MRISVLIVSYRRAWALAYVLHSLTEQTLKPDEIIIVLKPSGDGSEKIIESFYGKLPINLIIQKEGNFADAYTLAIKGSSGDLLLFIDDDAIAHPMWIRRYEKIFNKLNNVGGASGITYLAIKKDDKIVLTNRPFYSFIPTRPFYHRMPMEIYRDYVGYISKSGFMGRKQCNVKIFKSCLAGGANMAFLRSAIEDCHLSELYHDSKTCFWNESLLAYEAKLKGYETYQILDPNKAPVVWHIWNLGSLTNRPDFWGRMWRHFDVASMYWRLKALNADVSLAHYLIGLMISLRRDPLPRILATAYALAYSRRFLSK